MLTQLILPHLLKKSDWKGICSKLICIWVFWPGVSIPTDLLFPHQLQNLTQVTSCLVNYLFLCVSHLSIFLLYQLGSDVDLFVMLLLFGAGIPITNSDRIWHVCLMYWFLHTQRLYCDIYIFYPRKLHFIFIYTCCFE